MSDAFLDLGLERELAGHAAESREQTQEEERLARQDLLLLRRLCHELRLYIRQREMNAFWRMGLMVADMKRPLSARQRAWARTVDERARKLKKASRRFTAEQLDRLFRAMPDVPKVTRWRHASRPAASIGPTRSSAAHACGDSPCGGATGRGPGTCGG